MTKLMPVRYWVLCALLVIVGVWAKVNLHASFKESFKPLLYELPIVILFGYLARDVKKPNP